jgi:hypothetical protein
MAQAVLAACCVWLLAGCERTVHVFAEPGCDANACASDAATDAGMSAQLPIAPARFPDGGTLADFRALSAALPGRWTGRAHGMDIDSEFELVLHGDALRADGTFRILCKPDDMACDPFGPGSAMPGNRGSYWLNHVDGGGSGIGEYAWSTPLGGDVVARFWDLRATASSLSFSVGYASLPQSEGEYARVTMQPTSDHDAGAP